MITLQGSGFDRFSSATVELYGRNCEISRINSTLIVCRSSRLDPLRPPDADVPPVWIGSAALADDPKPDLLLQVMTANPEVATCTAGCKDKPAPAGCADLEGYLAAGGCAGSCDAASAGKLRDALKCAGDSTSESWQGLVLPNVTFRYLSRWSSSLSWPGGSMPSDDEDVLIPSWQTMLLDVSTARLAHLAVEGALLFDDQPTADLTLTVQSLHVSGGYLEVGTLDRPFQRQAVIAVLPTGSGQQQMRVTNRLVWEKGSARNEEVELVGVISLHGTPRLVGSTRLAAPAQANSSILWFTDVVRR
jgi:hypothetical protein